MPLVENEFRRVEIGFALTAGVLFGLLYLVYRHPHERAEDVPRVGSPEELEATLASIRATEGETSDALDRARAAELRATEALRAAQEERRRAKSV